MTILILDMWSHEGTPESNGKKDCWEFLWWCPVMWWCCPTNYLDTPNWSLVELGCYNNKK